MKANVLDANSGYLIEAFVEINGRISSAVWIVNTNILPYNGTCELSDAYWGNYDYVLELMNISFRGEYDIYCLQENILHADTLRVYSHIDRNKTLNKPQINYTLCVL